MVKRNSKPLNLRIEAETLARWKMRACAEKRTLTNLIEFVMEQYIGSTARKEELRARRTQ